MPTGRKHPREGIVLKGSTSGAGLLVGALILGTHATTAHAATVKWRVGPLELAAGQAAEVGISNVSIFSCKIGVQILVGVVERGDAFELTSAVDTISHPKSVPAGRGLVEGVDHPAEARGPRRLVQARVEAACPAGTDAQVRRLPVVMTIIDRSTGLRGPPCRVWRSRASGVVMAQSATSHRQADPYRLGEGVGGHGRGSGLGGG